MVGHWDLTPTWSCPLSLSASGTFGCSVSWGSVMQPHVYHTSGQERIWFYVSFWYISLSGFISVPFNVITNEHESRALSNIYVNMLEAFQLMLIFKSLSTLIVDCQSLQSRYGFMNGNEKFTAGCKPLISLRTSLVRLESVKTTKTKSLHRWNQDGSKHTTSSA